MASGMVGILAALSIYQLFCFNLPVHPPKLFNNRISCGIEPLEGKIELWCCDFTPKCAHNTLMEFVARSGSMFGCPKGKIIATKRSTAALAYCLCLYLLLISGNVERNPGPRPPTRIFQQDGFKLSTTKGLRICDLNVRSLVNKIDEMRVFCESHMPHVLCLNETWLDSSINDGEIQLDGYSLMRRDKTRRKGGVLVCVSCNLTYDIIQEFESDLSELECLWLEITPPKSRGFIPCSCKRSPNVVNETVYTEGLRNMLVEVADCGKEVVIIGDLNFDWKLSNKPA